MTVFPIKGCDYSTSHPKISALPPAGIKFVIRYVSPGANPKNLTLPELTALRAAGIEVGVVFESFAGRMKGGHDAGVADAGIADVEVRALGMTGIPVYFAADWDVQPSELALCDAYLDGVASVIGRPRTGVYGGLRIITHVLDLKKAAYAWQTYAWSGTPTTWDSQAQLRQVKNGVPLGGGTVDLDEAHAADFGQWPRPKPPGPFRHVVSAGNTLSIDELAVQRGTTVRHLTAVTTANLNAENLAVFDAYMGLRQTLHDIHAPSPAMPAGMVWWSTNV